jgi:hypothetical protein
VLIKTYTCWVVIFEIKKDFLTFKIKAELRTSASAF